MHASTTEHDQAATARTQSGASPGACDADGSETTAQNTTGSTLIEFPGTGRNARPLWRKELSERVREIQQRRAREAMEGEGHAQQAHDARTERFDGKAANAARDAAASSKQLGLVPPPPVAPEMNPIVAAALRRLERARNAAPHAQRSGRTAATATAVARAAEERYEPELETSAAQGETAASPAESQSAAAAQAESGSVKESGSKTTEAVRASSLVVVPSKQAVKEEQAATADAELKTPLPEPAAKASVQTAPLDAPETADAAASAETQADVSGKSQGRRIAGVIDETWLERREAELLPKVASAADAFDDRAPLSTRVAACAVDLVAVAFLSAPFAAVIELTIGNWGDPRVAGSMAGIVAVVMFLYLTCSTALAGRTWGMSLFSMHTVDARTALAPTTGQCVRRALIYMLSLAAFGLGILYALFDAEGRTAHDRLSGTVIVKG
ncbi:MAG TPA: RDD family protein [Pyrinomonadaceae bacterium]|nr:RDD family protein [Pyrinomonadaceae bacterium]